jgi:hypothetical protein
MIARVAASVAWTLCGLIIVLVCCVLTFDLFSRGDLPIQYEGLLPLVGMVASALVGALVASRRPHNPVGRISWSVRPVSRWARPLTATPSTASSLLSVKTKVIRPKFS